MIAMHTPVCYSKDMKKLGGLLGLFGVAVVSVYFFADELLLFLMVGKIPFTSATIPPTGMLFFWVLVVPVLVLGWRVLAASFWKTLESIGTVHQRQLNRRMRLFVPPLAPLTVCLIVTTLLAIEGKTRSPLLPTPTMRRRLAPLPL